MATVDADRVRRRAAIRVQATALGQLVRDEIARAPQDCRDVIHVELRKLLPLEPTTVVPDRPMTETEVAAFGNHAMEFGKHAGEQVKAVPLDYLLWLEEQPDFRRNLRRYLRSDTLQRQQDA